MPNIDLSSLKLLDRHIKVIHKRAEGTISFHLQNSSPFDLTPL